MRLHSKKHVPTACKIIENGACRAHISSNMRPRFLKKKKDSTKKPWRCSVFKQGRSLGRQLARACKPALDEVIRDAAIRGVNVWFLGRDCGPMYAAYKKITPRNVRYLKGLNRECAGKLDRRGLLHVYLRELCVRADDVLIDSGFRGSIFDRIVNPVICPEYIGNLTFYLLSADKDCRYASFNVKRSIVLALEHSPKPEVVEWDSEARRPVVHKIARTGHRTGDRRENACGLDQVSKFISGFVAGYNM